MNVFRGFLAHRAKLNALGFVNGFQWCDGSFVEDKDPNDMDIVTFFHRPAQAQDHVQFALLANQNLNLFNPGADKINYHCEVFFVDFTLRPEFIVAQTHYWFGLFSHRRVTAEWKGLVQVPLHSPNEDAAAAVVLANLQQAQVQP